MRAIDKIAQIVTARLEGVQLELEFLEKKTSHIPNEPSGKAVSQDNVELLQNQSYLLGMEQVFKDLSTIIQQEKK